MNQGEFYKLTHQCGCGSGLVSSWYKDEKKVDVKACESCKPKLLYRIFEDRYLDIFQNWINNLLSDRNPGFEWVWEDLVKEKGCEQVVGLEEAKRRRDGRIMISCPNGDKITRDLGDRSVHILVPVEYAEKVLENGTML